MSETKEQVKHTPGPWESMVSSHDRNQKPLSYGIHAIGKSSRWIAQIEFESGVDNEDDANARLIAAAPELLEACNDVIQHWGAGLKHLDVGENNRLLVKMCEAENKAEGR